MTKTRHSIEKCELSPIKCVLQELVMGVEHACGRYYSGEFMSSEDYNKIINSDVKEALADIEALIEQAYNNTPTKNKLEVGNEYNDGYDAGVEAMRSSLRELLK